MYILDSSVVMAYLHDEPGANEAERFFDDSLMSTVNFAEVLQKAVQHGIDPEPLSVHIGRMGIHIVPFDAQFALGTASLWPHAKKRGLSLGDRACLALSMQMHGIAVTTDRAWGTADIPGADIHIIER